MTKAGLSPQSRGRVALLGLQDTLGDAIENTLHHLGCALTRAPCQTSALDTLGSDCPDLIVLEARSNDLAAFEITQAIRKKQELGRARILVLQNSGRALDQRRARAMGADGFLSMPFPMSSLRSEVGRLLEV